ncbi:MAG TPA: class I SAM-dependent methyltransferase [Mycobacterium sp.]
MSAERRRPVSQRPSYARNSRDFSPDALVVEAVSRLGRRGGSALDIGAGTLSSTRHLLSAEFIVDAVDPDPYTLELAAELDDPRLTVQCDEIRAVLVAEARYDVIAAISVLHLLPRPELYTLVPTLVNGLTEGGILAATFVGVHDSWAPTPWRATVVHRDEVLDLTSGLEVLRLDEYEYDGADVFGEPKRWHTMRGLFRKG